MSAARPHDDTSTAFAGLLRARDGDLPLDRAAALIARGLQYPDLDVERLLAQLDRLAAPLRERLRAGAPRADNPEWVPRRDPRDSIAALNGYLVDELGFRGNVGDYNDPRNSFLNDVLARRTGIPISLALVWIEVARRIDFPLSGVGFPGHFLVKYALDGAVGDDIYLDPFHGGAIVSPAELRERVAVHFAGRLAFAEHYLGAITQKQLLTRMLQNLKGIYHQRNDARRLLAVVDYLLLIAPWDLEQRRDRGFLALQLGDPARALEDLQLYEQFATDDPNLPVIRGYIEALRRRFSLGS